ncbi:Fimbrin [Taenia crassiceps]|uniref:Fimbrin n=1 Tax=Taenia crassiceps TaxID=6207 RepID=A0ABR4QU05_9CEST
MSFDEEQLNDLYAAFPDLQNNGAISSDDIRPALEKLGCPIAGHELREIQGGRARGGALCDIDELYQIYMKAKFLKIDSKKILKDAILKGIQEAKTYDTEHLKGDPDCEALGLIPIDSDVDGQLYERCKNGIILAKMINVAVPNTIDDRTLEKGESLKAIFKRNENLTLVVNSAAAIGCCMVNIGPEDISGARRHLVCGLIWQLIRKAIVDTITLAQHSELAALLLPGETLEQLAALKPEDLLMRWVNFHLSNANSVRRLTNFTTDLCDSEIYAILMEQITPLDLRSKLISSKVILEEPSLEKRAYMVMENARLLDAGTLLIPEDIYTAKPGSHSDKLNLGFIATLFNMYPGMETPGDLNIQPETLEEKTYRNWMNSMGVSPILIDIIRPGTVDWKQVTTTFDPKRELFQKQTNCVLVIDYSKVIGIKVVNISGEDIREGATKQILGLCFQFMRAYTHKLLKRASGEGSNAPIEDAEILTWVNDRLRGVGEPSISGFRDHALSNSRPIVAVLESISSKGASRNMLTDDNFANAVYALSSCRKAGARVYALPEHICTCNPKMIITIFACLIVLSYSLKVVPNQ